jgi:N-acetyl-anhydromuramyl-L-alanine amidase AmpD
VSLDWCPFAVKRPIVADNFSTGRTGQQVKAVVLHIAAGPLSAVFPTFNNPARKASAHFCVGKDGTIEQYVSVNDTAYGNGLAWKDGQWYNPAGKVVKPTWQDIIFPVNPNAYTISIEHEGFPADLWTEAMYDSNNRLLLWLAEQFNLTFTPHRTLIGHCEIDPVDKAKCPGFGVEYNRIASDLAALIAARKLTWMPINDQAALYRFAQEKDLGYPQTDEFEFAFKADSYIAQVFNLGIVFVKQGEWGNVKWVKKPG